MFVFSFELILFLSGFEIHFSPIICYFNARSATCIGYYLFFFLDTFDALLISL